MRVTFYLKGALQVSWRPADANLFNFFLLVKAIRSDGHFLGEGIYVQASEIAAILLDTEKPEDEINVEVQKRRVEKVN